MASKKVTPKSDPKSDPKNDPKSDPKKWTAMPKSLGHGSNDPWVIGGGKKKNPAESPEFKNRKKSSRKRKKKHCRCHLNLLF